MDLYGIKEDSMEVAKIGASALAGAAIAKVVIEKVGPMLPAGAVSKYLTPVLPIAVGLGVHSYGKAQFPIAAPGVAAGMVAVGLGSLIGALTPDASKATVRSYVPFAGLGADTYDTGLMGLGAYGAGVDAYMNGLGFGEGYSYAPNAPIAIQTLSGAPVQVLSGLGAGAPTQVQVETSLMGLGSSIVGSSAPMSASLM